MVLSGYLLTNKKTETLVLLLTYVRVLIVLTAYGMNVYDFKFRSLVTVIIEIMKERMQHNKIYGMVP